MTFNPLRPNEPAAGYYRITAERRFMYLQQDPAHTLRTVWQTLPVTCPICAADTGLTLFCERGAQDVVQVLCPAGHLWPEPLVDSGHFRTCAELHGYVDTQPEALWIIDAGFGEEPPPPIDYAAEITAGAKYVAKYAERKAKTRIRRAVRTPIRKAKKKALNLAFTPVSAVLRGAWNLQAGGVPADPPKTGKSAGTGSGRKRKGDPEPELRIPSVAKYRRAYGMPAPEEGPACLVCEDSGRITAPGISIGCTECAGPAAAAMAAAERKAERARTGKTPPRRACPGTVGTATGKSGGRTPVTGQGVTVDGDNNQPIRVNSPAGGGGPLTADQAAAVRHAVSSAATRNSGGVQVAGTNNAPTTRVTRGGRT
ncbi:hypothetical protein AS594_39250 [Streptomyces agglomeratus]|uniref:Uncharacterized protein n=1 Tax=Streptomyces agglomeratus TaxID=285458 RepID=A0A1E5NZF6_9ACTN|nr:hypothetical protein [Streptomyces agglomeratus]OEJ21571.1 hypothetical protein AS594_39250 [Streptomyces agglomeratus]